MIKAILLDLDNTLLINPDRIFVTEYLRLLRQYFKEQLGYTNLPHTSKRMIIALNQPRPIELFNADVVRRVLSEDTGIPESTIQSALDEFFLRIYPELQTCVNPAPFANQLIQHLRKAQLKIVIATNPIYPENAVLQRMKWANLPLETELYSLITHSENMHFVKPDPSYYAEILARIGAEPDEAIMVGDGITNDIKAADECGLHIFQILTSSTPSKKQETHSGSLQDFYYRITDQDWLNSFAPKQLRTSMIEIQYRGNIAALFSLLAQAQPDFWQQRPDPNEWSIIQILCHLVESEQTQRSRLQVILEENNPFIVATKPPGPNIPICGDDGYEIAHQFRAAREETLNFLNQLAPEDWCRPARHNIFGLTTLLEMAHFIAQHDRLHINQLCETIGKCQ